MSSAKGRKRNGSLRTTRPAEKAIEKQQLQKSSKTKSSSEPPSREAPAPKAAVPTNKKKKTSREKLLEGEMCCSAKFTWKVMKLLGSGGFGDVYKVVALDGDGQEYAMKTETTVGKARFLRLKIEVDALLKCNENRKEKHFVKLIDRGKTEKFKFMVMELVDSSLEDYRKKNNVDFSQGTAMQIAIQSLAGIRDFHRVGFIHRDIKPHNFAYGLGQHEAIVYILDFGIARRIFDSNGQHRKARESVKFLGTMRYASRACHFTQEQGRKDDVETWLYMVCDLFNRGRGLAWRNDKNEVDVVKKKLDFFHEDWYTSYYEEVCPVLKDLFPILDDQNRMVYQDEPPYVTIEKMLRITASNWNVDTTAPLDWMAKKTEETSKQVEETQVAPAEKKDDSGKLVGTLEEEEDEDRKSCKVSKKPAAL